MKTAQEQFIEDFFLVADNTQEVYRQLMDIVNLYYWEENPSLIAEKIETWWEKRIDRATERLDESTSLFVRQIMSNWGDDTWRKIARSLVETYEETLIQSAK